MIKLNILLVSLCLISAIRSNPLLDQSSADWSARTTGNDELIKNNDRPTSSDSFSDEVDSTLSKREASPISGPLDTPFSWGARIESAVEYASDDSVASSLGGETRSESSSPSSVSDSADDSVLSTWGNPSEMKPSTTQPTASNDESVPSSWGVESNMNPKPSTDESVPSSLGSTSNMKPAINTDTSIPASSSGVLSSPKLKPTTTTKSDESVPLSWGVGSNMKPQPSTDVEPSVSPSWGTRETMKPTPSPNSEGSVASSWGVQSTPRPRPMPSMGSGSVPSSWGTHGTMKPEPMLETDIGMKGSTKTSPNNGGNKMKTWGVRGSLKPGNLDGSIKSPWGTMNKNIKLSPLVMGMVDPVIPSSWGNRIRMRPTRFVMNPNPDISVSSSSWGSGVRMEGSPLSMGNADDLIPSPWNNGGFRSEESPRFVVHPIDDQPADARYWRSGFHSEQPSAFVMGGVVSNDDSVSSGTSGTWTSPEGIEGGVGSAGATGSEGGVVDKQKVDWALNPGDNRRMFSSVETPEIIEQKKEETLPLAPESYKQFDDLSYDPFKNILPEVLTVKRRLAEGEKPLSSESTDSNGTTSGSSLVDNKGSLLPYDAPIKSSDGKSIPQHVYTEDQFPSLITIKGREYLIIPHKSNNTAQKNSSSPLYPPLAPIQGFHWSPFPGSPNNPTASKPFQPGNGSKSVHSPQSVVFSSPPSMQSNIPSGGYHHQFVTPFAGGNGQHQDQSRFDFVQSSPSYPQSYPPSQSSNSFFWSSQYPVYHSSAFTGQQVPSSGVPQSVPHPQRVFSQNQIPSVFAKFFPQYGHYPSSSAIPSGVKTYEFFTPPSHTVTVSSIRPSTGYNNDKVTSEVPSSTPSFITPSVESTVSSLSQGETKGTLPNPSFVPDPSFSPKLDTTQSSPSVQVGGAGGNAVDSAQQDSFDPRLLKPESNLHAPPQIPTTGFSVVAGSYPPIQSPLSVSPSSSSSPSKTHVESPVSVTVVTKFPSQSPLSPSSPTTNGEVKGVSSSSSSSSSSPSITVGSFNVASTVEQTTPKSQPQQQPQQQNHQQVGIAGETLVPTIMDAKHQFIPNSPFVSSGYFVSTPPVNQLNPSSSVYPAPSSSSSLPSPQSMSSGSPFVPQFDHQKFYDSIWQQSGYNSPSTMFANPLAPMDSAAPSYEYFSNNNQEPFYHQNGPAYDFNLTPLARNMRTFADKKRPLY